RACMSLALIVSTVSLMPRSFWHCWVIGPFNSTSEAGTKSAQRSQCTVFSWANAGARPLARIAASPPVAAAAQPPANWTHLRRVISLIGIPLPNAFAIDAAAVSLFQLAVIVGEGDAERQAPSSA